MGYMDPNAWAQAFATTFGTYVNTKQDTSQQVNGNTTNQLNPFALNLLAHLVSGANKASNNPDYTKDIVNNIFRQGQIAFEPTLAGGNASGIYSGATEAELADKANADATGAASSAVLSFKTAMKQLGMQGAEAIAQGDQSSKKVGEQNTQQANLGKNGGFLSTVVCTALMRQGKLPASWWAANMRRFSKYTPDEQACYFLWSKFMLKQVNNHPNSKLTVLIAWIFRSRAEHFAALAGVKSAKLRPIVGYSIHGVMWIISKIIFHTPFLFNLAVQRRDAVELGAYVYVR